jgi:hypothetical protein
VATKVQYDVFKAVYDEEHSRYTSLAERAKLYQAIITFYLGAIILKADDFMKFVTQFQVPSWPFLLSALVLLISLVSSIVAMRIRPYEGIADLSEIIHGFGNQPPTDDAFLDERLVDLAVATDRNSEQNDRAAKYLECTAWLLVIAVLIQLFDAGLATRNMVKGHTNEAAQATSTNTPTKSDARNKNGVK